MSQALARPAVALLPRRTLPARTLLLAVVAAASAAGFLATSPSNTAATLAAMGPDWARLLRAMAALKLLFAAASTAATIWRLQAPVTPSRLAAYALAAAALWSGPFLIWGLAHIPLGALLLHAGLAATVVLLWRDPAVAPLLSARVRARAAPAPAGLATRTAAAAAPRTAAQPH